MEQLYNTVKVKTVFPAARIRRLALSAFFRAG